MLQCGEKEWIFSSFLLQLVFLLRTWGRLAELMPICRLTLCLGLTEAIVGYLYATCNFNIWLELNHRKGNKTSNEERAGI